MYTILDEWTVDKLDWHHLGCMIAHCIVNFDDYHDMTVLEHFKKDTFISKLIDQGVYSDCWQFHNWQAERAHLVIQCARFFVYTSLLYIDYLAMT